MDTRNKLSAYIDTLWLLIGELLVSLIVTGVYLIIRKFDYTVVTGALLGSLVTTLNFFILSVGINRAVNKYIEERGDVEMDEEEAEEFARKHGMDVQNAMTKSYLFRMLLMVGSLFLALITGWFNVIATVVPLLTYRPVMYAVEFAKTKLGRRGE